MSQAPLKSRRKPNLKRYSEEEIKEICRQASKLFEEGRTDEADELISELPLLWQSAEILKELIGIEAMIESGANLSEAVDHFGYQWLER